MAKLVDLETYRFTSTVPYGPQPYVDPIPEPEGVYPPSGRLRCYAGSRRN